MRALKLLEKKLKVQKQIYKKSLQKAIKASIQLENHQKQLNYLQQIKNDYIPAEGKTFNRLALLSRQNFVEHLQQMLLYQIQQVNQDKKQCELCNRRALEEKKKLDILDTRIDEHKMIHKINVERKEQALIEDLINGRLTSNR